MLRAGETMRQLLFAAMDRNPDTVLWFALIIALDLQTWKLWVPGGRSCPMQSIARFTHPLPTHAGMRQPRNCFKTDWMNNALYEIARSW